MTKALRHKDLFFDFAVALSLITLIYIEPLREFIFTSAQDAYYLPTYGYYDYLICLGVLLSSFAIAFLALRVIRKIDNFYLNLVSSFLIFPALLNPVFMIVSSIRGSEPRVEGVVYTFSIMPINIKILFGVLFLTCLLIFIRFYWQIFRSVRLLCMATFPFAILVIGQLLWHTVVSLPERNTPDKVAESSLNARSTSKSSEGRKVFILLFDELDYRLAFPERPAFLRLPEFDRFSEQAIVFTNAPSLAPDTKLAIPSLLTGKRVNSVTIIDHKTIQLHVKGIEESQSLPSTPNLFSEANQSGWSLSIVGAYHPYCRMFHELYTTCTRLWKVDPEYLKHHLGEHDMFLRRLTNAVLSAFPDPNPNFERVWQYGVILQDVKQMVKAFDVNLIYAHIMLPHAPYIFSAKRGRLTSFNFSPWGYFDNIVLADHFLGEIRRTMEQAGLWDETTVLITSDHPWKKAERYDGKRDDRIPLLLKMPGQRESVVYEHQFSSEHVKDLILSILAARTTDPPSVVSWIKAR
jgi:hypothetical protein